MKLTDVFAELPEFDELDEVSENEIHAQSSQDVEHEAEVSAHQVI